MGFLQGVGSAYYKGECGNNEWKQRWRYAENPELRLEVDGSATSYLHPVKGSSLYLENMNLTELPSGVFDGLEHLRGLYLKGNCLRTLPEGLFRNLSNLSELHLQSNCLRTLPEGLFQNLSGLRYLYLQNNGLEELPSSVCA